MFDLDVLDASLFFVCSPGNCSPGRRVGRRPRIAGEVPQVPAQRGTRRLPDRQPGRSPPQTALPRHRQEPRLAHPPHRRAQPAQPHRTRAHPHRRSLGIGTGHRLTWALTRRSAPATAARPAPQATEALRAAEARHPRGTGWIPASRAAPKPAPGNALNLNQRPPRPARTTARPVTGAPSPRRRCVRGTARRWLPPRRNCPPRCRCRSSRRC